MGYQFSGKFLFVLAAAGFESPIHERINRTLDPFSASTASLVIFPYTTPQKKSPKKHEMCDTRIFPGSAISVARKFDCSCSGCLVEEKSGKCLEISSIFSCRIEILLSVS